ncbi:MAG: phosphatase PAP2 family protein [Ignavibacteriae bacterium]|nr:phosphatase PAP2 family protein [Ignavibacteriota bacterium]NOG99627.1 phosphatase PAP2 family protein [Ignavibacteriota bacterium]
MIFILKEIQKLTAAIFILILINSHLFAQQKYDFPQFGDETADFLSRPVKWNLTDWAILGGLGSISYLLMHVDENVRTEMLKDRSYVKSVPMVFGTYYGEPITPAILGGLFLAHGIAKDNRANKKLGFEILQSYVYSVAVTGLIKFSFGRARPLTGSNAFSFYPYSFKNPDYLSFSSGHTAIAFAMSTVFYNNVDSDILKAISYLPAFITGFSRMYHNKHWASDVFMGAAVGYFVAKFAVDQHKRKDVLTETGVPSTPVISIQMAF